MNDASGEAAAAFVRSRGFEGPFDCAAVLGTGLGGLVEDLDDYVALLYAEIPGFPQVSVSGHSGRLISGRLGRARMMLFQGRAHYYETGDAGAMRVPIAMLRGLGAPPLLLTNAAGSTSLDIRPGALALIADHINLAGTNPLLGDRHDARFVPLTQAYDPELGDALRRAAAAARVVLHEGTYAWFSGPSFETPAEIRMARALGADLVGMSTVPEVILARYCGLRVAAISLVTNMAAGIGGGAPSHDETKRIALQASGDLRRLVRAFVVELGAAEAGTVAEASA